MSVNQKLEQIYQQLFNHYGPQRWWPADEPFEVIVGAILTQSTAWINVEKAMAELKKAGVLNPVSLREISIDELGRLIRSSGYYNVKARKLKAFVERLGTYEDSLEKMFATQVRRLTSLLTCSRPLTIRIFRRWITGKSNTVSPSGMFVSNQSANREAVASYFFTILAR